MHYTKVESPVFSRADHSAIDCFVTFDGIGRVPFTAYLHDIEATSREIYNLAFIGDYGPVGAFVEKPAVVPDLSRRQFYQGLALKNKISQAEALAAVKTGALPAVFAAALSGMSSADAFTAEMLLSGAASFVRAYPLVGQLGQALGYSSTDLDDFWLFAGTL